MLKGQQLAFIYQIELAVLAQELFDHRAVFFRLQTARAVNENATGFELRGGTLQQIELSGAQSSDFLWPNAPAQIDAATHDAGIRARCVEHHSIEKFQARTRVV